jgi:AP2 domain
VKEIPLTRGYVALVDGADFDRVMQAGPWRAQSNRDTVYAVRMVRTSDGKRTLQMLHRFLLGTTDTKVFVDHANRNGLHNWRGNLRIATRSQNKANGRKYRNGVTSQYRGVCWERRAGPWHASIRVNGRKMHLGRFTDELSAALAYDTAAREHFGEFASCNFPPKKPVGGDMTLARGGCGIPIVQGRGTVSNRAFEPRP